MPEEATDETALTPRELYGGAMRISLPASYKDVSPLREVPDNQEVFADGGKDRSFIIELLEKAECASGDAARWHFDNLASEMDSVDKQLIQDGPAAAGLLANLDLTDIVPTLAQGFVKVSKYRDAANRANTLQLSVAVLRLERVATDLLITLNYPLYIHEDSSSGVDAGQANDAAPASQLFESALRSFAILDWTLFDADL